MIEKNTAQVKTVHLIFKTHLDVGFTDYAHNVVDVYFNDFIPRAMHLARQLRDSDTPFRWTIGSWIIYEYLEQADASQRREMEEAIRHGDIVWHGLPFTTHTELMDPSLFRFGLSYAQELDRRYGKRTIAAKMTDVPGHTRGIVPLLQEAGIEFLHIGVNPASMPPDVPSLFVWKDEPTDTQLTVMYHTIYGDISVFPQTDQAIAIVLTGDNLGPPALESIHDTYQNLRETFPTADITASTLDQFAESIRLLGQHLPVITEEIGDTWIHGAGTDPTKVRQYRALLRMRKQWLSDDVLDEEPLKAFSHALIMVPEHTWGMDEKRHLPDKQNYTASELTQIRQTTPVQRFEASWTEQRNYLATAINALKGTDVYEQVVSELANLEPQVPALDQYEPVTEGIDTGGFEVGWDEATGAINHLLLKESSRKIATDDHRLGSFIYEVFSQADYGRFWQQYIRESEETVGWAWEDYMKSGLPNYRYQSWQPILKSAYQCQTVKARHLLLALTMPQENMGYGAPRDIYIEYIFPATTSQLDIRVQWFEKTASRLPEAFWFSFQPIVPNPDQWRLHKLGQFISPLNVISQGGRSLHAVEDGVFNFSDSEALRIMPWDAPLAAFGKRSLLNFSNERPDLEQGVHFNLYNNVWGTNFPMWFDDDVLFRFTLSFEV